MIGRKRRIWRRKTLKMRTLNFIYEHFLNVQIVIIILFALLGVLSSLFILLVKLHKFYVSITTKLWKRVENFKRNLWYVWNVYLIKFDTLFIIFCIRVDNCLFLQRTCVFGCKQFMLWSLADADILSQQLTSRKVIFTLIKKRNGHTENTYFTSKKNNAAKTCG